MGHIKIGELGIGAPGDETESSDATAATQPQRPCERAMVNKFIFGDGQDYLAYLEAIMPLLDTGDDTITLPEAVHRMHQLQLYKTNENIPEAAEQIKQYGFTLPQTPHIWARPKYAIC